LTDLEHTRDSALVPKDWTYAPAPEARDVVTLADRYGHFVGGEWIEAEETYTTISPATEEPLAERDDVARLGRGCIRPLFRGRRPLLSALEVSQA